jgi:mono/diheme cytochrome c family protein
VRVLAAGLVCLTALLAAGCGTGGPAPANADKSAGKQIFINGANGQQSCGTCHTLAAAGTLGKVGPNLDDAFRASRQQGFAESTIRDIVRTQISEAVAPMPKNLVTGQDADDVAAYVASVAGLPVTVAGGGSTSAAPPPPPPPATTTTAPGTTTTATTTQGGGGGANTALVAKGQSLYTSLGCVGCHSIDGSKGTGPTFKGLAGSQVKLTNGKTVAADDAYLMESIVDPDKVIVQGFSPGVMSAVIKPGSVSQADAKALVAYIASLK